MNRRQFTSSFAGAGAFLIANSQARPSLALSIRRSQQVTIEAKFVEVVTDDLDDLGFRWSLDNKPTVYPNANEDGSYALDFNLHHHFSEHDIIKNMTLEFNKGGFDLSSFTRQFGRAKRISAPNITTLMKGAENAGYIRQGRNVLYHEAETDTYDDVSTAMIVTTGETIVVGGLIRAQNRNRINKVPQLGKLPIIGEAFRTQEQKHGRHNVIIFISPKIIRM